MKGDFKSGFEGRELGCLRFKTQDDGLDHARKKRLARFAGYFGSGSEIFGPVPD